MVLVLKKWLNYSQEKDLNVQPNKVDVDLSDNMPADKKEDVVLWIIITVYFCITVLCVPIYCTQLHIFKVMNIYTS